MKHLYGIPYTFCAQDILFEDARIVILPVPYESTVSYMPGTRFGPRAIIEASRQNEGFDKELGFAPEDFGIFTLDELEPNKDSPQKTIERVQEVVEEILEKGKFPVILGGEHSISLGAIRAVSSKMDNVSVLYFDAHPDMRDELEGTKYSYACVMRRASEICPVVGVGIREMGKEENKFIKENGMNIFDKDADIGDILEKLSENVYISIDLDVLDPSIMPSVGTPVPEGMSFKQLMFLLKKVTENKNIVGFDVCELRPIQNMNAPDTLASKIITKLIGYAI